MIVTQPSGGQTWIEGQTYTITWRDANIGTGLVNIDVMTFSGGVATLQSNIITGATNNGHYTWIPSGTIPPGGNYLIRVTQQGGVSALSPAVFSLAAQVHTYYVNDATVQTGDWTTAPGNDANSGLDSAHPKASIASVLASYTLGSLDTIMVDAGTYNLAGDITLLPAVSGITIEGYNSLAFPTRQAILNRGNTTSGACITLDGAANITIDHLVLTGGLYGFQSSYQVASNNAKVTNCVVTANASYGIYLLGGADNFTLNNNLIHDNDGGLSANYVANITVTNNTLYNHRLTSLGISSNGGLVSGNLVYNTHNNNAIGASSSGSGASGLITMTNNVSHDNTTTALSVGGDVLATGNTTYNNTGVIGINVSGGEAHGNISYNNYDGIYVSSGLADQNRVYNNSYEGIYVSSGATASQNQVYSNATGIEGNASPNILNNIVYANTTRGIWITAGVAAQVTNNTVYQPAGDAIDLLSSEGNFQFQHMQVRDNILWAQTGYDLNLTDDAGIGFISDYNDLYVTGTGKVARISNRDYPALSDWIYEYAYDTHSISADPKFVNVAGPDGILGYGAGADYGTDDNFHLQSTSPAIDAGDPTLMYLNEPAPNGGRINLGNFGNTTQADPSPAAQSVQVTSPSNLQKLEAGHQYTLSWQTTGVVANQPVLLMNTSGQSVGFWTANAFSTTSDFSRTITNTIDTSGVSNPAPQQVYQTYVIPNSGSELAYQLPVPNGNYTLRLHFMDDTSYIGKPVMNIKVNGVVLKSSYDLFASVGAAYKATTLSFNVTASGGTGLFVELISVSGIPTLSAMDLSTPNPTPVPSPTANLQVSTDSGNTWNTIATNQPIDAYGHGSFQWIPSTTTTGPTALFRATINNTSLAGTSQPFAIYNGGTDYYVNDSSQVGDTLTTAIGNNANSGKSSSSPVADIQAVLSQYNPGAGATIHVDTGTYVLVHNLTLTAANSGLKIQGPATAAAVINRANTVDPVISLTSGADNITLDHLSITGGSYGIFSDYYNTGTGAMNNIVSNNQIYANTPTGLFLGNYNTGWLITGNSFHDNTNGNNQGKGIDLESSPGTVTNNKVFNESQVGIYVSGGAGSTISGNETYADGTGIQASGALTITNNLVHDNATYGIYVSGGALVIGNTIYRQIASGAAGIYLQGGEARSNIVYYNYNGIATINSTNTIDRNDVYSNTNFGILVSGSNGGTIENLVYANSAAGIVLTSSSGEQIANNTVYQLVGDAVRFTSSPNAVVRSNILWVEAGDDLDVTDTASQSGLVSDYNDLYRGPGASAHVGFWGAIQDQLANWQTAASKDPNSIASNPQFLSAKGADQVLGYSTAGSGYNGGVDDNFYLSAGSPAIDRGYAWAGYATDILNQPRADDPGTTNAGSNNFVPTDAGPSQFAVTGTAMNWRSSPSTYWNYTFTGGFAFPFYGTTYTAVSVSTSGLLQFAGSDSPAATNNSDATLLPDARIAAMWATLRTDQAGNNIYVDTGTSGQVKFTWVASNAAGTAPVNFSVVLFNTGQIRFDYGAGNANLSPTVGISMGDDQHATFLTDDNSASLANAHSMLLGFQPGFVDMGAYEFEGSSTDTTSPQITATSPAAIQSAGTTSPVTQIGLTFSEPVNSIDANAPSDYQLVGAGPDGLFGTADDISYALTPVYTPGSTQDTLKVNAGSLPAGLYRLTVFGSVTGIHNLSGLLLDGTASGVPGSNYVRTFTVALSPLVVTGAGNDTITISSDGTNTDVWVNHNPATDTPDYQRPTSGISSFTIIDGTGNEKIILDYSSGHDPLPPSGLSIAGNGDSDILQLTGTTGNDSFNLSPSAVSMGAMTPVALNPNISGIQISGNGGPDTLAVTGGTPAISSDLGTGSGSMSVTLSGTSVVSFKTAQHLASLAIGAGATAGFAPGVKAALFAMGLTIGGTGSAMGTLDLADSDLVLAYGQSSPYDSIRQWVQDGTVTGRGIVSSTAPATPATTVGLADNAMIQQTVWDGQTVSDGTNFKQILTTRALVGDTNLDGKVDQADYVNIIANMGRAGATYFEGDLNHDGVVTVDDLAEVTANLGAGAAFAAGPALSAFSGNANSAIATPMAKQVVEQPATQTKSLAKSPISKVLHQVKPKHKVVHGAANRR
ncbi:MAG: right-handed parallel beta-helix repeat-containing protein [Tepidisphaeraceae bacterium]